MPPEKIPPKESQFTDKEKNHFIRGLSHLSQVGITIFACILIGVFLGRFLDQTFNTSPWLLLIFSFLGVGAAFKYLFDLSKKM